MAGFHRSWLAAGPASSLPSRPLRLPFPTLSHLEHDASGRSGPCVAAALLLAALPPLTHSAWAMKTSYVAPVLAPTARA